MVNRPNGGRETWGKEIQWKWFSCLTDKVEDRQKANAVWPVGTHVSNNIRLASDPKNQPQTCNWFVPFPSPWAGFIFAFALLLTCPAFFFFIQPPSPSLFSSLISCISISQSFSASPEGAHMTSEKRGWRGLQQRVHRCSRVSMHLYMHKDTQTQRHQKWPTVEHLLVNWECKSWKVDDKKTVCRLKGNEPKIEKKKNDSRNVWSTIEEKKEEKRSMSTKGRVSCTDSTTRKRKETELQRSVSWDHITSSTPSRRDRSPISPLKEAETVLSAFSLRALQIAEADERLTVALQHRPTSLSTIKTYMSDSLYA